MTSQQWHLYSLKRQSGLSLFEIVLVILIIGVLMSMAVDRLVLLQIETERVSVQHVIGTLDSAVYVQTAETVLKQGLASLRTLENTNPMGYLAKLPHNYVGVRTGDAARNVAVSNWYFDPVKEVLVYRVKNKKYFESDIEGEPRIRLKLTLVYRDGVESSRGNNIQGIKLRSLHKYNWKTIEE